MKLHRFVDPHALYDQARTYLLAHEVQHMLLMGVLHTLRHHPKKYDTTPYLALVEEAGNVQAIALQTPPFPVLLSVIETPDAIGPLVADLAQQPTVGGITAPLSTALAVVPRWHAQTGQRAALNLHLKAHQLTEVRLQNWAAGSLCRATSADLELLRGWHEAFHQEAMGTSVEAADRDRWLKSNITDQSLYFWVTPTGQPVCFASVRTISADIACIGPVYTPPAQRCRGYASTCVAAISQQRLDQGYKKCALFTDVLNPTSNKIYRQIGYEPLAELQTYHFVA